jgi:phenylacetate-CoA ligase
MPLLRYSIGDYARVGGPCPCGRGLPVLTSIAGRVRNMLALPSGERFWPRVGSIRYRDVLPVRQFQMAQTGRTSLELRLVADRKGTPGEEAKLTAMVAAWAGYPFAVTYRYLDEIPRGAAGKYEDFKSGLV